MADKNENKLLLSQIDDVNLLIIEKLLTDSNIPFMVKRRGMGGYMKIAFGSTYELAHVYVSRSDYETAKEITDIYFALPEEAEDQELAVEDDIKYLKTGKWIIRIVVAIILLLFSVVIIGTIVEKFV